MSQIDTILRRRASALLARFNTETMPPLATVPSLDSQALRHIYGGGTVEPLPGHAPKDAVMWRFADPDRSSVWVEKSYQGYTKAFRDFLALAYGLKDVKIPGIYDIDHIHNRDRAPNGFMIRVEAVIGGVNRSHGAGFEKQMGGSPVTAARLEQGHTPYLMSFVSALKLAEVKSPLKGTGAAAKERRAAIIEEFATHGWDRKTVENALDQLEEVAGRR